MTQQANPSTSDAAGPGTSAAVSPSAAPNIGTLVARSGDLKGELVEFVMGPKFSRALTAELRAAADKYGPLEDDLATLAIDQFALQHRLPDGRTPVQRFVAERRPRLPDEENDVPGGRAAGLRTIWISDGTDGVEADHVVSDAAEAIDLLLDLERARA